MALSSAGSCDKQGFCDLLVRSAADKFLHVTVMVKHDSFVRGYRCGPVLILAKMSRVVCVQQVQSLGNLV